MGKGEGVPFAGASGSPADDRLDSWKEIAAYLKRDVRTVQRWEKIEGLPVNRHLHDKIGSVYAYKSELDVWWKERRPKLEREQEQEASQEEIPEAPRAQPLRRPKAVIPLVSLGLILVLAVVYFIRHESSPPRPTSRTKIKLLVLPFVNLNGDPQQEFFSDGFTEEMITQLSRLHPDRLGVVARATAMLYKGTQKSAQDIGQELGVDYILEGSVRRAGDRVRISAQFVEVSDQTQLWAENYDRDVRDILALQGEVARAIASQIQLALSPQEQARLAGTRPVNPDAYEAYLQGLSYWNKRSPEALEKSASYFRQAIEKDPNFALAYAGLASSYSLLGEVPNDAFPPRQAMVKAKEAAGKALKLDDSLAEAHAALALVRHTYDWDWDGAEQEYRRALELNPGYATARQWYSLLLRAMGRHEESLQQIQRALEMDPLSPVIRSTLAEAYYFARQYDRVIELCQKALDVEPDFVLLHYRLGRAYAEQGKFAEAIAELEKAKNLSGDHPAMVMALGHAYGVSGRKAEALQALQELNRLARKRYVPALYFAAIYTGLGDKKQAFRWLDKAYQEHTGYLIYLNVEPMADPLRSDPRFTTLLQRIGLSPRPNPAPVS